MKDNKPRPQKKPHQPKAIPPGLTPIDPARIKKVPCLGIANCTK